MWSVKCRPKPGLARISASRSGATGAVEEATSICSELSMWCTVPNLRERRAWTASPAARTGARDRSAGYSRGDRVADLGGPSGAAGVAGGEVGHHGVLDRARRVVEPEVLEQQRSGQDRGGR